MTPSVQIADGRRVTRWNRESIIEKIAEWHARHGEPPVSADWNPSLARWRAQEWRAERYYDGAWPSTNAVKRAFGGSFDAAVRAAGFEPARPGPRRRAHQARPAVEPRPRPEAVASRAGEVAASRAGEAAASRPHESAAPHDGEAALVAALARADALEARLASAERRAERAEERLRESRRRAKLATDRATRARRTRDRVLDEADARVRAALDQADAAVRDAEALRRGQRPGATGAGPAGPAPLAAALRRLASARASGDRHGLRRELGEVAASALRWRDRL